jgi:hypothetical protein
MELRQNRQPDSLRHTGGGHARSSSSAITALPQAPRCGYRLADHCVGRILLRLYFELLGLRAALIPLLGPFAETSNSQIPAVGVVLAWWCGLALSLQRLRPTLLGCTLDLDSTVLYRYSEHEGSLTGRIQSNTAGPPIIRWSRGSASAEDCCGPRSGPVMPGRPMARGSFWRKR